MDKILITYKKGIANILITDLPDAVRVAWGLPSDEEINAAKMAQKRFVEEQQAKGLVLYRDNWITPIQKISIETQEAQFKGANTMFSFSRRTKKTPRSERSYRKARST